MLNQNEKKRKINESNGLVSNFVLFDWNIYLRFEPVCITYTRMIAYDVWGLASTTMESYMLKERESIHCICDNDGSNSDALLELSNWGISTRAHFHLMVAVHGGSSRTRINLLWFECCRSRYYYMIARLIITTGTSYQFIFNTQWWDF